MSAVFPVNSTGISVSGIQAVYASFVGRKALVLAGYVFGGALPSLSRVNFNITAATSQTFTFNAYLQGGSNGAVIFKLSIDGGSETDITCITSDAWATYTVDLGSLGAHSVQLRSPATDNTIAGIGLDFDSFITAGTGSTLAYSTGYGKVYGVTYPTSVSTQAIAQLYLGETTTTGFIHLRGNWKFDNSPQRTAEIRFQGNITDFKIQTYFSGATGSYQFSVIEDGVLLGTHTVALTVGPLISLKGSLTFNAVGTHDYRFIVTDFPADAFRIYCVMAVGGTGIVTSTLTELPTWDFYGDSITAGDTGMGAFCHAFQMGLAYNVHARNLGIPFARVKHTAGDVTNVAGETRTAAITAAYPLSERVILLYGINDLLNRSTEGSAGAADETKAEFQAAYQNMLELIAAGTSAIMSSAGMLPNASATEPQRLPWNQAIIDAQAAAITGGVSATQFTDVANVGDLVLPGDYLDSATHPNEAGYDKIEADFAATFADTTPPTVLETSATNIDNTGLVFTAKFDGAVYNSAGAFGTDFSLTSNRGVSHTALEDGTFGDGDDSRQYDVFTNVVYKCETITLNCVSTEITDSAGIDGNHIVTFTGQAVTNNSTVICAVPSDLALTPYSTVMRIHWTANTEPVIGGYKLYRSTTLGGTYSLVATLGLVTTYLDTGLDNDQEYYYKITSLDLGSNESAKSSAVNATPTAAAGDEPVATGGVQNFAFAGFGFGFDGEE